MVDVAACEEAGIALLWPDEAGQARARTLNAKATADLTVAMVLCLAYRVVDSHTYTKGGGFRQEMTMDLMGTGCTGKTAGVIGLGVVGSQLVPRLQAFEMEVLYTKRTRLSPDEELALGVTWADKDDLLARSDFVCMMANYNPSAHMLLGEREFQLMQPSAYFVNTTQVAQTIVDAIKR
jgi:glyoxylate reductase